MNTSPYQPRRMPGRSSACNDQSLAIINLNARVDKLKKENAELQKRVDTLEQALKDLKPPHPYKAWNGIS